MSMDKATCIHCGDVVYIHGYDLPCQEHHAKEAKEYFECPECWREIHLGVLGPQIRKKKSGGSALFESTSQCHE